VVMTVLNGCVPQSHIAHEMIFFFDAPSFAARADPTTTSGDAAFGVEGSGGESLMLTPASYRTPRPRPATTARKSARAPDGSRGDGVGTSARTTAVATGRRTRAPGRHPCRLPVAAGQEPVR